MTTYLLNRQCANCKHLKAVNDGSWTCTAFPGGIPEDIRAGQRFHDEPYPGDKGIRFEPLESPTE